MKSKYILSSALSLAIVGASIVSPFSYALSDLDDVKESIFEAINTYSGLLESTYESVLSQHYQYAYVGLQNLTYNNEYSLSLCISSTTVSNDSLIIIGNSFSYHSQLGFGQRSICIKKDSDGDWYLYDGTSFPVDDTRFYIYYPSERARVTYLDLPMDIPNFTENNEVYKAIPTVFHKQTSSTFGGNINSVADRYITVTPTEPYTKAAPAFPNLPDNWVNGGGDVDIKIDLPDVDFILPDLPDYTLPDAATVPEKFMTATNTIVGKCWDIIVQSGLTWLAIFSLTIALISYIFSR